jgi:hypothetical protein
MRARLAIASSLALAASAAWAVETTQWPPPPEVLGRMRDLQSAIADPARSKQERAAARQELERLLKSPAGRDPRTADDLESPREGRPARAAIDPFPSVVKPIEDKLPAPPPTARLQVIPEPPRRPTINPSTGSVIQPSTGAAVDPRTGHLLHEVPGGYVDPRTGQFIPK